MRFDTVIVADWSAASSPSPARPSPDAIWIGAARDGAVQTSYSRTRHAAEQALRAMFAAETASGRRVLAGFDFPMGYPQGFASRLTGSAKPSSVWHWLDEAIDDRPDNRNNRFEIAAGINRRLGGPGPFWGRPAGMGIADLPPCKTVDYPALGLAERRAVEVCVPRAQPVWKLYTTGAVGSQALVGMPTIHRLSQIPGIGVWPFSMRPADRIVLAEVYPSILADAVARHQRSQPDAIKDDVQVRLLALAFWRLSQAGALAPLLAVPDVAQEEGWILGAGHAGALGAAVS